ncbi:AP-1 complex-associated regulatory protein isoform X4 [Erinaceus europaeus]|uniref:AP-1 complex-associated regulatory protein isoform X4 n=1 Tax=Erinaceus europaeus TaxID=9365 RepID=A0ABM3X067_ERIEU|nr:AP-1 complex-associated regulatory protein isoform X4 [Erinaceus europaeus]
MSLSRLQNLMAETEQLMPGTSLQKPPEHHLDSQVKVQQTSTPINHLPGAEDGDWRKYVNTRRRASERTHQSEPGAMGAGSALVGGARTRSGPGGWRRSLSVWSSGWSCGWRRRLKPTARRSSCLLGGGGSPSAAAVVVPVFVPRPGSPPSASPSGPGSARRRASAGRSRVPDAALGSRGADAAAGPGCGARAGGGGRRRPGGMRWGTAAGRSASGCSARKRGGCSGRAAAEGDFLFGILFTYTPTP